MFAMVKLETPKNRTFFFFFAVQLKQGSGQMWIKFANFMKGKGYMWKMHLWLLSLCEDFIYEAYKLLDQKTCKPRNTKYLLFMLMSNASIIDFLSACMT